MGSDIAGDYTIFLHGQDDYYDGVEITVNESWPDEVIFEISDIPIFRVQLEQKKDGDGNVWNDLFIKFVPEVGKERRFRLYNPQQ